MNKPITNGQVTRWILLLQEFNIIVLDRPGKENLVVDFLSHVKHEGDDIHVDDSFPDEHIFSLSVNTPWFSDMEHYSSKVVIVIMATTWSIMTTS
jgi:hypothetical protein